MNNDAGGFSTKHCNKACDHGSECTLPADHLPPSRHESEHGCVFYDETPELAAKLAAARSIRAHGEAMNEAATELVEEHHRRELPDLTRRRCLAGAVEILRLELKVRELERATGGR